MFISLETEIVYRDLSSWPLFPTGWPSNYLALRPLWLALTLALKSLLLWLALIALRLALRLALKLVGLAF